MLMLEEEAVQVLEISTTCKKGTKLVVKRACMGTKPTAHPVHAPVLALPQMVSHRPGSCSFCLFPCLATGAVMVVQVSFLARSVLQVSLLAITFS
jgi:hypothetical protein